jgi:hypothetical protein
MKRFRVTCLFFCTCALVSFSRAQFIAFSNAALGGGNGSATTIVSETTLDGNFASAIVSRGSGLSNGSGTSRYNSTNWPTSEGTTTNDYLAITLTPNANVSYSLTQIAFTIGSSSNINNWSLRGSADNYATPLASGTFIPGNPTDLSITASALGSYSSLTGAIEFRLYGWG